MISGKKTTVGIIFGGKSAEHDVSLQSAKNIYDAIDRDKFEPVLIGIDKGGKWLYGEGGSGIGDQGSGISACLSPSGDQVALIPESAGVLSRTLPPPDPQPRPKVEGSPLDTPPIPDPRSPIPRIDVVFPILHGPFGEDGTVQGLLKLAGVPFVGSGVLGSAVGMDKDVMKRLFREAGIPIGKFLAFRQHEPIPPFAEIEAALGGCPFFVKPANMGSSVGISKVHNEAEFSAAINEAFQYDTKIVIEEFIQGREIECAVLGNENPAASVPGEIIPSHEFYSYEAKYLDEKGAVLQIPAQLDGETEKRIREISIKVFQTLCCDGLARVDSFLRENGDIIVNEINTMPGFTRISMYPKLWEAGGLGYTDLITRLIELAMEKHEKERALKISRD
jgi:D-alanine-D-alanine ligase